MRRLILAIPLLVLCSAAEAAPAPLVSALRQGGYVVVMRHARSPGALPVAGAIAEGNALGERQLDDEGRRTAVAVGRAIKAQGIPVGDVFTSPTFRAMQTVRYADLAGATPRSELGDGGSSMAAGAAGAAGDAWLKAKAAEPPRAGSNTFIVTHGPNIGRAFNASVADGEAIVFKPGPAGAAEAGRIKIDAWGPAP